MILSKVHWTSLQSLLNTSKKFAPNIRGSPVTLNQMNDKPDSSGCFGIVLVVILFGLFLGFVLDGGCSTYPDCETMGYSCE